MSTTRGLGAVLGAVAAIAVAGCGASAKAGDADAGAVDTSMNACQQADQFVHDCLVRHCDEVHAGQMYTECICIKNPAADICASWTPPQLGSPDIACDGTRRALAVKITMQAICDPTTPAILCGADPCMVPQDALWTGGTAAAADAMTDTP